MKVIEINGLTKTFSSIFGKRVHALRGVDLQVRQGEIFGLLGPNGAGKTTLVKILLSICFNDGGQALLFEEKAAKAKSRDRVGYLPESHKYPRYLKGRHIMDYYAKLSGMSSAKRKDAIENLLTMVRMQNWQDVKMGKYSKGMQQRVGLAAAMVSDPDLLVLDEPTDGVDPLGRKEIRDILVLLKERGKTIFLNSHLLSEVELICDRIAILNKGKIVQQGSVEELTAAGNAWAIEIDKPGDNLIPALTGKGFQVEPGNDNELIVTANDLSSANDIIDAIRAEGALISSFRQKRRTLEDMFIDVIKGEGEASVQ